MPPIPNARVGAPLLVRNRQIEFSYWPMRRSNRRYGLQTRLFVSNPWSLMRQATRTTLSESSKIDFAISYLDQAQDLYTAAAVADVRTSRPLLLYYCFLNLVKALVVVHGKAGNLVDARHGLSFDYDNPPKLKAYRSTSNTVNVFDEFVKLLTGQSLPNAQPLLIGDLASQILVGHRLSRMGKDIGDRFIAVEDLHFLQDKSRRQIWLQFSVEKSDLDRFGYSRSDVITKGALGSGWHLVRDNAVGRDRELSTYEQTSPTNYTHRPSDVVDRIVKGVRHSFWRTINTQPPFQKYYVLLNPTNIFVLPQLASIYAMFFYFGSITRYNPPYFREVLNRKIGPFCEEFLENQHRQLLYGIASEFVRREIVRAAIV